ncbi:MAG: 2,5-diamino-6-(ribosylamino)-4(3H)-pyrimidinone 5'-phosphate reductase [Anaerolineae bacterium]|jgi:2,5-diamino-6-(ribosylamino)-4(3H)-pyrimidinone 5'-phosphate reductase|nr:2,5-diamino-6-(ribosylamino)-4(3H)-pyrimidinone 5'-phosphate reductase [Anaerolineae bacterium]MBT7072758.1 2,5-diamino-6-(ribosylamino)-4(3H)-pyrimidinone 5'-phosphate reductase [Anaerolineae bacterium]MBT7324631.1 2,5-diamino-6-(ribosylamino)-4(3H)-pyrimidinone 5'-phosphate reductase [Anaerolineae bacterium]
MKVIINVAMTLDGKIDNVARRGAKISSDSDWDRVDRLRAESDAILVGGRTLLDEDPRLTVKSAALRDERVARGFEPDPVKVGIVSNATLTVKSRFLSAGTGKIIIFTTEQTSAKQLTFLREAGAVVCVLGKKRVDLNAALAFLEEWGIENLMVEGGGGMNAALLTAGLVDEIQAYIAPLIFGGATAPTLADGAGILDGEKLDLLDLKKLDDGGVLLRYQVLK